MIFIEPQLSMPQKPLVDTTHGLRWKFACSWLKLVLLQASTQMNMHLSAPNSRLKPGQCLTNRYAHPIYIKQLPIPFLIPLLPPLFPLSFHSLTTMSTNPSSPGNEKKPLWWCTICSRSFKANNKESHLARRAHLKAIQRPGEGYGTA